MPECPSDGSGLLWPLAGPESMEATGAPGAHSALAEQLVEQMVSAWKRGEPVCAEQFLRAHPELDEEAAIRLIYEEICQRRDAGQACASEEVAHRFPQWKSQILLLLSWDRLMRVPSPADFPKAGDRLGDFQLLGELGQGAWGRTYMAAQPALGDRMVVLKVTPHGHDEHLSLARLQHAYIVPLYSVQVFPERNLRALCMPYLGGANLAQIFDALALVPLEQRRGRHLVAELDRRERPEAPSVPRDGPMRQFFEHATYVHAVCLIGACLADALQYAHERGLVHMDVKPANVLISTDGQPMLLDFHLARGPLKPAAAHLSRLGGTPGWMSPEQEAAMRDLAQARPVSVGVDCRSDIFSLGLLLARALGLRRFDGGPLLARASGGKGPVSVGLRDIVTKCLAADPADRYPNAASLAEDLRRHLTHLHLKGVRNRSLAERWQKWRRRRPRALGRGAPWLSTLVPVLLALMFAGAFYHQRMGAIEAALEDGLRQSANGQFPEAIVELSRGLAIAERTPAARGMAAALRKALLRALRGQKAGELHALADMLRFRYAMPAPPKADTNRLLGRIRAVWDERGWLLRTSDGALDAAAEQTLRADLLELALLWADLRVRFAAPEDRRQAQTNALEVLDEAHACFGSTALLDRRRLRYTPGLGQPCPKPATSATPATAWEFYDLGRECLGAGQPEAAAEHFQRALELRPQDFWCNFYQGLCAFQLGHHEEAIGAFRTCIALAPQVAECYYNRALAYEALGKADLASRDYTRATQLDPAMAALVKERRRAD